MTTRQYVQQQRNREPESRLHHINEAILGDDYSKRLADVWEDSYEAIWGKQWAVKLLHTLALIHPDGAPVSLLTEWLKVWDTLCLPYNSRLHPQAQMQASSTDSVDLTCRQALSDLADFSLVQINNDTDTVSILRLVQNFAREKIGDKEETWSAIAQAVVARVSSSNATI